MDSFCLHKVADFWSTIKMSWLRRLPYTKSLWRNLHVEEVGNAVFNPMDYNMDMLEVAKKRIKNPVWAEVYSSLKKIRRNVLDICTEEFLSIPLTA